jgi:hypothetical protein
MLASGRTLEARAANRARRELHALLPANRAHQVLDMRVDHEPRESARSASTRHTSEENGRLTAES